MKIMSKISFKDNNELICLSSWFMFSFFYIVNTSLLSLGPTFKLVQLGVMGVMGFLILTHDCMKLKKIVMATMLAICCLLIIKNGGKKLYLVFVLFLMNSEYVKFDKLVKCTIAAVLLSTLLVVALSVAGVIPDYIFIRDESGEAAHSLGFVYYYNVSAQIMFVSVMYLYIKDNVSWFMLFVIAAASYVCYKLCTTRLPFFMLLIVLIMYVFMCKFTFIKNLNTKFFKAYSMIAFPAVTLFCVVAALNYNSHNAVYKFANEILNGRLSLSKRAFNMYGIKLLGQPVEMRGRTYGEVQNDYFFIDSGYILGIIEYGLLFTVIIVILYSIIYLYACRENDKKLFIWITMILVFNVVNGCWLAIMYNPVLYVLFYMKRDYIYHFISMHKLNKIFHYRRER
ncbi:MAG: hypothetical protein NC247_08220 [Ruminococcus flavefaciens]|nr:hypothetical protein [Ruminococcus flavefaciens]MCM1362975.1 hypothetical protein [Clostridiales bacterium]